MLHVIVYDIASDKRLRRVARICEDYGFRMEKSVFECDLEDREFEKFWKRLSQSVADADMVIDYPIPQFCRGRIRVLGAPRRETPPPTLVF